jgi:hypothetical protein
MESGICSHPLRFESDEDNRALDEYVAVELDVLLQKREAVKMESSSLMAGRVTAAAPCIPRQDTLEQARAALDAAMALYRAMQMQFWLTQTEATLAQAVHAPGSPGVSH